MKTIFVVDDSDTNLFMAEEALEKVYSVMTIPSALKMFSLLEKVKPDLILLDIEMPEMNGFKAMEKLKAHKSYTKIPVIFLTGQTNIDNEVRGFELGAVDFITKPFSPPVLLNRIKSHLNIDELIHERTLQLHRLKNGIASVLADMVESRDMTTGGHIKRTMTYLEILMREIRERDMYCKDMKDWDLETVIESSCLHDVGKIVVSDIILNKPSKLTVEEFEVIKKHTTQGKHIIDSIAAKTGDENFLSHAKVFAGYHHEHWDGSGYPYGLKGEDIPLQGRIMTIVDVYDALVSERPYKKPFSHEAATDIILSEADKHFDPRIIEVFSDIKDQFKAVAGAL